jgi:hypothetical protein
MKKTLSVMLMTGLFAVLSSAQAFAVVPTIDGANVGGEWLNDGHPYYLSVTDPNELDNAFDNTDISLGVVLQELDAFGGTGGVGNDGIYILLEVWASPPTLAWDPSAGVPASGIGITGTPTITMQGDLLGDGLFDPFNIFLRHYNTDPTTGLVGADVVEVCVGTAACLSGGVWTDLVGAGGAWGRGSVLEYYIPAGTFGTPPPVPGTPFPLSFVGTLTYDNGLGGPNTSDDIVVGGPLTNIPEPGTTALLGLGLLGLVGMRFKNRKSV